jgi:hypothetical protein
VSKECDGWERGKREKDGYGRAALGGVVRARCARAVRISPITIVRRVALRVWYCNVNPAIDGQKSKKMNQIRRPMKLTTSECASRTGIVLLLRRRRRLLRDGRTSRYAAMTKIFLNCGGVIF